MPTLTIPAPPPTVPVLEPTPDATTVTTDVDKARQGVAEASDWAQAGGAPTDWDGSAADAAEHARSRQMADLDVAVAVLHRAQTALMSFTSQMDSLRSKRAVLVDRRSDLSARQNDLAARGASYTPDEEVGLLAEASTLGSDIDAFVADVEAWQRDVTATEDRLIAVLTSVDTTAEGQQAVAQLGDDVQAVVAGLVSRKLLPAGAQNWSAAKFRTYLIDHPSAARALMKNRPFPGMDGPAGLLGSLVGPAFIDPAGGAEDAERRRDGLRALFESLPPQEASLLAMLYPGAVGNAAGVPFQYRADANTVAVITALDAENAHLDSLRDQREQNQNDGDFLGRNNNDLDGTIDDAQKRIALYESIIGEDRQILLFDPSGDGAIAELHGQIDSTTHNVGVHVPGTTTEMASFQDVADRSNSFVDNSEGLAMVSWMGGDLPDGVLQDAPFPDYAQDLAPRLAGFSHQVRQEIDHSIGAGNDMSTTYLGHSYGGAVVGLAETHGLDADRVLHVESAGMGAGVDSGTDLPPSQDAVDRYSMTAPGDPIGDTQGIGAFGLGHGADPDDFPGTTRLDTGNKADGSFNTGKQAHGGVFEPRSDAWRNQRQTLTGGDVQTYREPTYDVKPTYGGPPIIIQDGWSEAPRLDIE